MTTATFAPITKNLTSDEPVERGYRLLMASVDSPEFRRFLSSQFEKSSDGPAAA